MPKKPVRKKSEEKTRTRHSKCVTLEEKHESADKTRRQEKIQTNHVLLKSFKHTKWKRKKSVYL